MKLFPNPKRITSRLQEEFKGKRILDLAEHSPFKNGRLQTPNCAKLDLNQYPWPFEDNTYDLILCQHVIEHLADPPKALEEINRITTTGGKVFIETPHYTWFEAYRHFDHCHRFSFGSFDYFIKGNPCYKTDFHIADKYIFFDEFTFLLGIGFLANFFPKQYEKRLAFIFPATSFYVTLQVDK